jgi:hypothetical protein
MVAYNRGPICGHIVAGERRDVPRRKGERQGPARGERSELQKMKNSGNEAKKSLKTKESHFFECAIYERFARKLARI